MSLQDAVEILICQPCNNWLVPLFPDFSCVSCCFFGVCISARVSCVWSLTTRISPSGSGWPCECLQGLPVPGAWQGGEPPSMCGEQVCRIGRNRRQGWMPLDAQIVLVSLINIYILYLHDSTLTHAICLLYLPSCAPVRHADYGQAAGPQCALSMAAIAVVCATVSIPPKCHTFNISDNHWTWWIFDNIWIILSMW